MAAAFERILSGSPGLDTALDSIRLGDNVVWQVSSINDYRFFMQAFAKQAIADGRTLVYVRFASHAPIFTGEGFRLVEFDPDYGFEAFSGAVHDLASEVGRDAFYIFDSLSELETAWAADLMMGNFFMVSCPYLFELNTVANFALVRHRHSYETIARIRETTQLLLELYSDADGSFYIHPLKVWKRYSSSMFLPHLAVPGGDCIPLTDALGISKFYALVGAGQKTLGRSESTQGNLDSWDRFFLAIENDLSLGLGDELAQVDASIHRIMGLEPAMGKLARQYFGIRDLLSIRQRLIGSGKIGGKAVGMLLARQIVGRESADQARYLEPHDSYYIGTDVFYTYLVHNGLWTLRMAQRKPEGFFVRAAELQEGIRQGSFPDYLRGQFVRMLEYYGQSPVIVRSSSLLEDSFGHAFAGKYESVFCANTASPEQRLLAFEDAVRTVFASTMDESALTYRHTRGLDTRDEQMALLVQRVSGSHYANYFLPVAAGVAFSHNAWRWDKSLDPGAGMLRLVAGLGTRAVDRTGGDYPRLLSLDQPQSQPHEGADRGRYSQHSMDVLDLSAKGLQTLDLSSLEHVLPNWLIRLLWEHDTAAEAGFAERGIDRKVCFASCHGLSHMENLLGFFSTILAKLEKAYGCPVDTEFTINLQEQGDFLVNLLQCRPLHTGAIKVQAKMPEFTEEQIFMRAEGAVLGPGMLLQVYWVLAVDPVAYYNVPYAQKPGVARAVGQLAALCNTEGESAILLAPGRLGTSSPELGLTVSFAEIRAFAILVELACEEAGYQPELSYGSHFFQDLVEAGIVYAALDEQAVKSYPRFSVLGDKLSNGYAATKQLDTAVFEILEAFPDLISLYAPTALWAYVDSVNTSICLANVS